MSDHLHTTRSAVCATPESITSNQQPATSNQLPAVRPNRLKWPADWRAPLTRWLLAAVLAACVGTGLSAQTPGATNLGTINFPTSAAPAAQGPFLVGVKALFNFEFDIAYEAFLKAEKT